MQAEATYDDVRNAFDSGSVASASKQELERLLIAVGKAQIQSSVNQARAAEMGETMRIFLSARQSQEMHSQALTISRVALWVSFVALIASVVQIVVALF